MAILLHIEDIVTGNTFGERLRNARLLMGFSAQEVAERVNIKYATYMSYETRNKQPKQEVLVAIANLLNISTDQLLGVTSTRNGKLVNGRLVSLGVRCKIDIKLILSALLSASRSNSAVFYDDITHLELPLDKNLKEIIFDAVHKIYNVMDEKRESLISESNNFDGQSSTKSPKNGETDTEIISQTPQKCLNCPLTQDCSIGQKRLELINQRYGLDSSCTEKIIKHLQNSKTNSATDKKPNND